MKKQYLLLLIALIAFCGFFMFYGDGGKPATAPVAVADTIVIYDGLFAEMNIIHYVVKELVEAETSLKVEIRDEMAPVNLFNELLRGGSDLMNSYDGTLLTTFLLLDPSDVPEGVTLYDFANAKGKEMKGVMHLGKLGINNTYAIAVPQEIAEKHGLETISDLAKVSEQFTFGAEHDFFTEAGMAKFNPFSQFYGLKFKDVRQIDINLKYSAIKSGNIDVTVVYSTDGLNREANLKVLADDRNYFPEYNGALLVRTDFFDKYKAAAPDLDKTFAKLDNIFTDEDMIDLTYEVDINNRTPQAVAKEYLQKKGLIK